jgi:hypothetical protein
MLDFISQLGWRPTIGDPTFMGWLTVVAYAAAGILCLLAGRRVRLGGEPALDRRRRRMWMATAALMGFLCLNKQLDLQTLLTKIGREIAVRGGWYGERRIVQFIFVLAVALAGITVFALIVKRTRLILKERKLLLFGLCFLVIFIIVRAASFHHVAEFLATEIWGVRMNWALELGGIALIGASAVQDIRHPDLNPGARP